MVIEHGDRLVLPTRSSLDNILKITFVVAGWGLSGGDRVIAIYADRLRKRGHDVLLVAPALGKPSLGARVVGAFRQILNPLPEPAADLTHLNAEVARRRSRRVGVVDADDVPDSDVVIATWWETAEWVNAYPASKGAKAYFVQHHEVHSYLPVERVRATYRLPLFQIVIARWLADVMRNDYGVDELEIVPNSVDHAQFHAAPRTKQARPTVGVLYATADWKRFEVALQAIKDVHSRVPNLRVRCFGGEQPEAPFPDFFEFTHAPAQSVLRDIYSACDVWLTASSSEGFNLTAMEAMACRTPVVATRTGWPAEAVIDGVNGACVAVDDVDALARETERVLNLAEPAWQAMSERAFATVRDSSWERSTELFEAALIHAVAHARAREGA